MNPPPAFLAACRLLVAAALVAACASSSTASDDDDDGSSRGASGGAGGAAQTGGAVPAGGAMGGAGGGIAGAGGSTSASAASTGASSASAGVGGAGGAGGASSTASSSSVATSSSASSGAGGSTGTDACGFSTNGVWFQIDYTNAFTATNPTWTYSPTPGWGEADWAAQGSSWPEVWDLYQNINVSNDPIGKLAVVGSSGVLQIMIGIGGISSYSKATVCVEGRSVSTSSSVQFDVYNPLNNCGVSATMAHNWVVHAVGVDLGTCLIPGNDFQAIRVEPWGGSGTIGVKRLRLTLHDAVY